MSWVYTDTNYQGFLTYLKSLNISLVTCEELLTEADFAERYAVVHRHGTTGHIEYMAVYYMLTLASKIEATKGGHSKSLDMDFETYLELELAELSVTFTEAVRIIEELRLATAYVTRYGHRTTAYMARRVMHYLKGYIEHLLTQQMVLVPTTEGTRRD